MERERRSSILYKESLSCPKRGEKKQIVNNSLQILRIRREVDAKLRENIQRMKVLIVEDDPLVANDLEHKLDQLGYSIRLVANSSVEAKNIIREQLPDLAIVDIELGVGESGIDLGHWFDQRNIPYFYLSGKQDTSTFIKSTETKGAANIEKPISLSTLRNTIHHTLQNKDAKNASTKRLFIPIKDGEVRVDVNDILFIRACRAYCEVQLVGENRPIVVSMSLGKMMERINTPEIMQIHRSHAININRVQFRKGNLLSLDPNFEPLEIGKKYREIVRKSLESN